mgnify:CR=1 FL=1
MTKKNSVGSATDDTEEEAHWLILRTAFEGRNRLALPPNHPDERYRLHCGKATDGSDGDPWDAPWRVDEVALAMPWRPDGLPASDTEKVTMVRLVVFRAFEAARTAEGQRRGKREATLVLRKGDPLLGNEKLPDILDRAWAAGEAPSASISTIADVMAERLGVVLNGGPEGGARLRAAVAGKQYQGREPSVELPAFVRVLALWWFENTARRPEREINPIRRSKKRVATFVDFVLAASVDVSRSGQAEPEGVRSAIRREVERMERSGKVPW